MSKETTERAALASAIRAKAHAESELAAAEKSLFGTRQLLASCEAEVNQFVEHDRAVAHASSQAIKAAMRGGGVCSREFEAIPNDLPRIVVARAAAEARVVAARQAAAELAQECALAREAADRAAGVVQATAARVALAEAEEIAAAVEDLSARADGLRMMLGGGSGSSPLTLVGGLGEATRRVLASNDQTAIGLNNSPEMRASRGFADRWRAHIKQLAVDANATFSNSGKSK
jgi:hypothetical protein